MILPHFPGNKPTTDRQTGQGQGEPASCKVLFPLPPLEKKVKHWPRSPQIPTPPIAAFVGPPTPQGGPEAASHCSSFTLVCSWQPRALLLPLASGPVTLTASISFYHLLGPSLSSLGPPCPRASGEAVFQASPFLPARALPGPLPRMWDSHGCPTFLEVRG